MKKDYIKLLIKKRMFIAILCVMIVLGGLVSYFNMPKQNFPEVVLPVAAITAVYPGASAEDMEQLVAKPLEDAAMALDGFDSCTTQVYENYCTLMVVLDMNLKQETVNASFEDLRFKVDSLRPSLPAGVQQITVDTDIMDTAGLLLAVSSAEASGDELYQRTGELKDRLKLLNGVKKVDIVGEQVSEIAISVDADRLNGLDISLAELAAVIGAQNSLIPAGTLRVGGERLSVRCNSSFAGIEEIRNVVIGADPASGILYRLADVADVELRVPEDRVCYYYNGTPATVIALYFAGDINVVTMGDDIRRTVAEFSSTLPQNIQVHEVYLQSDMVSRAVNSFVINLLEAVSLVLIVVMVGMGPRNGLIVSVAIPLAILANFLIMPFFNVEIQFVSLAALIVVMGMLVDNSVVVSDAIQARLDMGENRLRAAINGTHDVAKAVFVSMLTTVAAFAALLTITGANGQLTFSMPVVIITCLLASFLISLLVTPLTSFYLLRPRDLNKDGRSQKLVAVYDKFFQKAYAKPKITLLCLAGLLAAGLGLLPLVDLEVVAKADKDVVIVELIANLDNDLQATKAVIRDIEAVVAEQPEVLYYLSGAGAGVPRFDYSILPRVPGDNLGDFFIRVDLKQGGRFRKTCEFVEYLQNELDAEIAGGRVVVDELGVMSLVCKPVEIKLYSDDLTALNAAAELVVQAMRSVEGTKCVINSNALDTYGFYVDMDPKNLNSLGLTKAEVQNELSIALLGRSVSLFLDNGKEYDVVLDSGVDSLTDLKNYQVKSSVSGQKFALQQFAQVTLAPRPTQITRLDGERGRAVGCYARTGESNITIQTALEKQLRQLDFPDGVRVEKSGEKKDYLDLTENIIRAFVFSFVLIFLILMLQFNSWKKVLLLFISVPFGALAGVFGLFVTGQKLSLFALLGIISLLGCVLANAIVLVEYIDNERDRGGPVAEACRSAGARRFRPILMSTTTTVLGLFPLAIGGDTLFIPMAVLMMFGLTVSMVINLIVVPIAYSMLFRVVPGQNP